MKARLDTTYDRLVHILAVDDDATNLLLFEKMLKDVPDIQLHLATSGVAALNLARRQTFALVLLDLSMPVMDGYETARQLQELETMKDTLIIFITAFFCSEDSILKGYGAGCVDYLSKPVNVFILRNKVMIFAEMFRKRQELAHLLRQREFQNTFIQGMLDFSRRILNMEPFEKTARGIFDAVKDCTGGTAGYVALLSPDGQENEVLFLDAGGKTCTVSADLPMPVRGLRARAYESGRVVYDNDFSASQWMELMPEGHLSLDNVLFGPLKFGDDVRGILGIANKPGGFTDDDAILVGAYSDLAALSLRNARLLDQLHENRSELNRAQMIAGLGSFRIDLYRGEEEWSDGLYHILGVDKANVSPSFETLVSLVAPKDKAEVVGLLDAALCGESTLQTEFSLPASGQGRQKTMIIRMETDCDAKGKVRLIRGTCQDISEQRFIEQKVRQSRHLEAIGSLAGGVAHEINTPIQYMSNNVDFMDLAVKQLLQLFEQHAPVLLKNNDGVDELEWIRLELPRAFEDFRQGLGNVSRIVETLQMLSPARREMKKLVDINELLRNLADLAIKGGRATAPVSFELAPALPLVPGAVEDFSQVLLSVLINAFQAVDERFGKQPGGEVRVGTLYVENEVVISISDNGRGIPEELGESIFDPFFTTREQGEGTGQGLALARAIVESCQGNLEFTSMPGQGSVFIIRLPV